MGISREMAKLLIALTLVVCVAGATAIPSEESIMAMGDLMTLVQEKEASVPQVADYSREEFAGLMNKIIGQASKMRVVMNKLGISDTESVQAVEAHFIKLGEEQEDLGDGMTSEEELRQRGLQARNCVSHGTSCSRMAAACPHSPKHCPQVVKSCARAASSCGIGESKSARAKAAQHDAVTVKRLHDTEVKEHAQQQKEAEAEAKKATEKKLKKKIHLEAVKSAEQVYRDAEKNLNKEEAHFKKSAQTAAVEDDDETDSVEDELEAVEAEMDDDL